MILAIVPARSGSKSVKDKNIKLLNGLPLMAYSIKAAKACRQIDKIVVSSDSQEYLNLAQDYGAEVILRPKELAGDDAPMLPVLQHAVREVEKQGDGVEVAVLLDPTSPLRLVSDIEKCLEELKKSETKSVVTVTEVEHNPYFVMAAIEANGYIKFPLFKTKEKIIRRQDAPKVYRINAAVYVIKKDILMKGEIFTDQTRTVIIPEERTSHIDTNLDFLFTEFLLKEGHAKLDY
ncbi:MAG: acylneuraminate cytidylyltransferase family protein [Candidatus Beckwithbacteria bacterium]|nr:acylneuraminate cytidylyltransferase family protein [Patescibacteria group bacterium]